MQFCYFTENSRPATCRNFEQRIRERLDEAYEESSESHKAAMNSYGAGFDAGFVAALRWVLSDDE